MLIGLLSIGTGCAVSTNSGKPILIAPDATLTRICERPVLLPDRGLTQAEVEAFWRSDRARLLDCRARHEALAAYIADRDARLSGGSRP